LWYDKQQDIDGDMAASFRKGVDILDNYQNDSDDVEF
jgi:hypothetical protein